MDTRDRRRILDLFEESAETYGVRIFLFCLMPNHVHLLVETPRANLDRFMSSLLTGYSVYFNRRHQRVGHLMQGRYGAQLVSGDDYLLKLSRYIHLNPVKTAYWQERPISEQIEFLRQYIWSSYRSYLGLTSAYSWLKIDPILLTIPKTFTDNSHNAYGRFVETGLITADHKFQQLVKSSPLALGPDDFIKETKLRYLTVTEANIKKEDAILRLEQRVFSRDHVLDAIAHLPGFDPELLSRRKFGGIERCLVALSLQRYAGMTQRDIAEVLYLQTGAAVSTLIKRYRDTPKVGQWLTQLNLIFKG